MKTTRSILVMLTLLSLTLSLMAGCAGQPATPAPVQQPATEAAQPTTASAKPLEGKEITVLLIADKTWVPEQAKAFEEQTGAKVNVVLSDYDEMITKFTAAAAAKSGAYDVVIGDDPSWFMAGYLEPLDEFMKELDQSDITGMDLRLFDGKRYGMPWLIDNRIFMYNEEILKKAGFDAPPLTWDEFYAQAKAIKEQGILEYPIMFPWTQHEGEFCDMSAWFKSAGGAFFSPDGTTAGTLSSTENASALEFLKKLNDEGLVNPDSLASKSFAVSEALAQGKAAFGTTWVILTGMLDDPEQSTQVGKVKGSIFPGSKAGMTGAFDGSESLAIPVDSKDKATAWEFIKFLTSKEIEKETFMEYKVLPIWISLYEDPELVAANPNLPVVKQLRDSILYRPNTAWSNDFSLAIQIAALEAITGAKSAQQALDDAAATMDPMIK